MKMKIGRNFAYVIKSECKVSGKTMSDYFWQKEDGFTTLVWCTKYYSKKEAKEIMQSLNFSKVMKLKVVKCFFEDIGV